MRWGPKRLRLSADHLPAVEKQPPFKEDMGSRSPFVASGVQKGFRRMTPRAAEEEGLTTVRASLGSRTGMLLLLSSRAFLLGHWQRNSEETVS